MKAQNALIATLIAGCLAVPQVWAADPQDHEAHHPGAPAAKPASKAAQKPSAQPAPKAQPTKADMAMPCMQMEKQMKSMHEMHEKFMGAKTPEERQALMDEHMKSMQSGMAMMKDMGSGKSGMSGGMPMQMRMEMMETMMQMMMDRMSVMPPKQ